MLPTSPKPFWNSQWSFKVHSSKVYTTDIVGAIIRFSRSDSNVFTAFINGILFSWTLLPLLFGYGYGLSSALSK